MEELEIAEKARQACALCSRGIRAPGPGAPANAPADSNKISIDDFVKVDMRVGLVLAAERVKGADKLLHLKVDIGEASREPSWRASPKRIRPSNCWGARW